MTRISGVHILAAPCCGRRYTAPRYLSMNFMAYCYWTDGWRDGSLMPNDGGLRRCTCGRYLLRSDLVVIDSAETSEFPRVDPVPDERLPECIDQADREDLELVARLQYWRHLNHPYRERYRLHRAAEEAATKAAWEAANPDRRNWWDKLRGRKAPDYIRPADSPFTFPRFEPSAVQLSNMQRLCEILSQWKAAYLPSYTLELAELYREQGLFVEAAHAMRALEPEDSDRTHLLISDLIRQNEAAPMRYQM